MHNPKLTHVITKLKPVLPDTTNGHPQIPVYYSPKLEAVSIAIRVDKPVLGG